MSERPRVVIADDDVLVREGIRQVLDAGGFEIIALVGTAGALHAVLSEHDVDAVILDIRMPPGHSDEGLRALERLRADGSQVGVLLLSMYSSPALAVRAMSAGGATGYLLKERITTGDVLVAAVRTVMRGGIVIDPEVVELLVTAHPRRPLVDELTLRERQVLQLMAEGHSNHGIASLLKLSVKTVETHVGHVLEKLGIDTSPSTHRRVLAVLELLRAEDT